MRATQPILATIGQTPMVELRRLVPAGAARVLSTDLFAADR